jgi:hypothetical protein
MNTNKDDMECIFCGMVTTEQHTSSIGVVFVHSQCLIDLEEILSMTEEKI